MLVRLCAVCSPKAEPYVKRMEEMSRKLEAVRNGGAAQLEQLLPDAEKLARAFDAVLCAECRKLGPRLPGPDEWPFSQQE
jgi:ribosomal protein L34E